MADSRPTQPVPPRSSKRRRRDRSRSGSSAEFTIWADNGEQHLVEAYDPNPPSDPLELDDETISPRVAGGRTRDQTNANRPGEQAPTLTAPQAGNQAVGTQPVNVQGDEAHVRWTGPPGDPNYWLRFFGRNVLPPTRPIVDDVQPANPPKGPVAIPTQTQTQAQLQARITALEHENAALRYDNANMGVAIAESFNVPPNDQEALLELARTANVPRGLLTRLLANDEFLEQWRVEDGQGETAGGGSRGGENGDGPGVDGRDGRNGGGDDAGGGGGGRRRPGGSRRTRRGRDGTR